MKEDAKLHIGGKLVNEHKQRVVLNEKVSESQKGENKHWGQSLRWSFVNLIINDLKSKVG